MTSPIKDSDGNTASHYIAYGVMWLLILIGFGGCCALVSYDPNKHASQGISVQSP